MYRKAESYADRRVIKKTKKKKTENDGVDEEEELV